MWRGVIIRKATTLQQRAPPMPMLTVLVKLNKIQIKDGEMGGGLTERKESGEGKGGRGEWGGM